MNDKPRDYLADIDLAAAIAASVQLHFDRVATDVTVSVSDGIVTLEGYVTDREGREQVELIARRFNVSRIVNDIAVNAEATLTADGAEAAQRTPPEAGGDRPASE
jgi:osmotically-inducible protein OsmY